MGRLILLPLFSLALLTACGGDEARDVETLSGALLTLDDLPAVWTEGAHIDASPMGWTVGGDPGNPPICAVKADQADRLAEVQANFEHGPFGPFPDSGGHGPFVYQTVAVFPEGGAPAFMDDVMSIIESCPDEVRLRPGEILLTDVTPEAEEPPKDGSEPMVTWRSSVLPIAELGDQTVAFRRTVTSSVQGADIDTVMIRRGDIVSVVIYASLTGAYEGANTVLTELFAHLADERLRELVER